MSMRRKAIRDPRLLGVLAASALVGSIVMLFFIEEPKLISKSYRLADGRSVVEFPHHVFKSYASATHASCYQLVEVATKGIKSKGVVRWPEPRCQAVDQNKSYLQYWFSQVGAELKPGDVVRLWGEYAVDPDDITTTGMEVVRDGNLLNYYPLSIR
jgi:hypothetical protein